MRIVKLDTSTAIEILRALGCENDLIFYKGKEMDPEELDYYTNYDCNIKASSIKIAFYSKKGKVNGSLYTMVVYRLTGK